MLLIFGMSKFDQCWRFNESQDKWEQAYSDLKTVEDDCKQFEKCLTKYGFKKRNFFDLSKNPTSVEYENAIYAIRNMLKSGTKK